ILPTTNRIMVMTFQTSRFGTLPIYSWYSEISRVVDMSSEVAGMIIAPSAPPATPPPTQINSINRLTVAIETVGPVGPVGTALADGAADQSSGCRPMALAQASTAQVPSASFKPARDCSFWRRSPEKTAHGRSAGLYLMSCSVTP